MENLQFEIAPPVALETVPPVALVRKNRVLTRIINRKNEELQQWNALLEKRVHAQTARIHDQNGILSGMNERLRKSFDDLIVAFSGLIELHDEGENLHSKVVADLAGRMAAVREFRLKDLEPGMVLARDVRSGTGVLLLRAGSALNESQLQGLRRYEEIDPFPGGVSILETG